LTADSAPDREIIYVGDPMCSWCWGFAPVAQRLAERFAADAAFRIITGGLRPGEHAAPFDDALKGSIRQHWDHVHEKTSQPFDYAIFDRDDFVYDTEPACKAVVCVRRLDPARTLDVFVALQSAFYAEGRDITDADVLADIVAEAGIDRQAFVDEFTDPDATRLTHADFAMASWLGAQGFPSVFLRAGDEVALLTTGYQPAAALEPAVERFFSQAPQARPEQEQNALS